MARLAGMPAAVTNRAEEILAQLEGLARDGEGPVEAGKAGRSRRKPPTAV